MHKVIKKLKKLLKRAQKMSLKLKQIEDYDVLYFTDPTIVKIVQSLKSINENITVVQTVKADAKFFRKKT